MENATQKPLQLLVPGATVKIIAKVIEIDTGAYRPHLVEFYIDGPNNYHARTYLNLALCENVE